MIDRLRSRLAHRAWPDLLALVSLAALTLIFFWKMAIGNQVLTSRDMFAYFYPYREFANAALRDGHLPLWNPYLFMGAPLLANSQVAVLYPLHWPLIWLSAPKHLAWSIVLHVWLAGAGTYAFGRSAMSLRALGAFAAAATFALGGFMGAQAGHVNQLNTSAWLPWLLLCVHWVADREHPLLSRWLATLTGAGIVGLVLLAGHTQAAFIVLVGAGLYALWLALRGAVLQGSRTPGELWGVGALALMGLLGIVLAVGQIIPTLELSQVSVRSGGLPYNLATSFSLTPSLIFKAFLPPYAWDAPFSEYVAYVGITGLLLAVTGAWYLLRRRSPGPIPAAAGGALVLAVAGVFLALGRYNPAYYVLYKLVPGFALFRAPARWLLLYSLGSALLAGYGLQVVVKRETWRWGLVLLIVLELFIAGRGLEYNGPTAPAAYDSLRTAPAHLLADESDAPFRFLSMSDIQYDPGDMEDLRIMYSPYLSEGAIYDLIVATKIKEVLGYNLPLRYGLYSLDGYDGGLLPTQRYVTLQQLFLPEDEISLDGRLRERLRRVPPARLLSPFNVKYIITDKTQDVWIDDVFYDLEHTVSLGAVRLEDVPDFETTDLGVVSYLAGTTGLEQGAPVAEITIAAEDGSTQAHTLLAGVHTAEGRYAGSSIAHQQARIGHPWRDDPSGSDYIAVLALERPVVPTRVTVRSLLPEGHLQLRGMSLIDARTGTSRNLSIDPNYQLVHSGDVKIYRNDGVLPRAFVAHQAILSPSDEETLRLLQDPRTDLGQQVILSGGQALAGTAGPTPAEFLSYEPEQIVLRAELERPGYLVLADAFYPGWVATVDGQPAPIQQANLYFRAVAVPAGSHQIEFRYQPSTILLGLGLSGITWLLWLLLMAVLAVITYRTGRKRSSGV